MVFQCLAGLFGFYAVCLFSWGRVQGVGGGRDSLKREGDILCVTENGNKELSVQGQ